MAVAGAWGRGPDTRTSLSKEQREPLDPQERCDTDYDDRITSERSLYRVRSQDALRSDSTYDRRIWSSLDDFEPCPWDDAYAPEFLTRPSVWASVDVSMTLDEDYMHGNALYATRIPELEEFPEDQSDTRSWESRVPPFYDRLVSAAPWSAFDTPLMGQARTPLLSTSCSSTPSVSSYSSKSTCSGGPNTSRLCKRTSRARHQCPSCEASYTSIVELERHAGIAGHKPFTCEECWATFSRQDSLARHRLRHRSAQHQRRFVCPICIEGDREKAFDRKDHLRQHLRRQHQQNPDSWMQDLIPSGLKQKMSPDTRVAERWQSS